MKKTFTVLSISLACCLFAQHPGPGFGPRHGPAPMHHHHHYSAWGHGGSHFWPSFTGGFVGSLIARPIPPPPPVVAPHPVVVQPAPVVVSQPVVAQPVVVNPPVVVSQPVAAPVIVR